MSRKKPLYKTYYFPFYCYREFPTFSVGIETVLQRLLNYDKIEVYKTYDEAVEVGNRMLCDDDCFGILEIERKKDGYLYFRYEDAYMRVSGNKDVMRHFVFPNFRKEQRRIQKKIDKWEKTNGYFGDYQDENRERDEETGKPQKETCSD